MASLYFPLESLIMSRKLNGYLSFGHFSTGTHSPIGSERSTVKISQEVLSNIISPISEPTVSLLLGCEIEVERKSSWRKEVCRGVLKADLCENFTFVFNRSSPISLLTLSSQVGPRENVGTQFSAWIQ